MKKTNNMDINFHKELETLETDMQPPADITEGMIITEGNTLDDTSDIIEHLADTTWKTLANQIPETDLSPDELRVMNDYKAGLTQTREDMIILESIFGRYDEALGKIKPAETIKNVENNIQLIQDEKELIRLYEEYDETRELKVNLGIGKQVAQVILKVKPLKDSKAIIDIYNELGIYEDITPQQQKLIDDYASGEPQSREEKALAEQINNKINKKLNDNQDLVILEFLSKQTYINDNSTPESMKAMYQQIPEVERLLIFKKVEDLASLSNVDVNNLFPEDSN